MRPHTVLGAALIAVGSLANAQTPTSTVDGLVVPARARDISAEMSNKINRLHFIEGEVVAEGDLLVEFDSGFKKLELELAEANLERGAIALEEAREVLSRQEELRENNTVSEAAYRDALFATRLAETDHRALEVQRDMADAILNSQKLYAPFDGQISAPQYRENANVNIDDSREIATIVQLDPIHVRAPVPLERYLMRALSGANEEELARSISVVLTLPDGTEFAHAGRILASGYALDPETNVGAVLIEFPNPDRILRPGMKVVVSGFEQ